MSRSGGTSLTRAVNPDLVEDYEPDPQAAVQVYRELHGGDRREVKDLPRTIRYWQREVARLKERRAAMSPTQKHQKSGKEVLEGLHQAEKQVKDRTTRLSALKQKLFASA